MSKSETDFRIATKAGKYAIRKSRYIRGEVVHASPEAPAYIDVLPGEKIDRGMIPVEEVEAEGPLLPHYKPLGVGAVDQLLKAQAAASAPTAATAETQDQNKGGKPKRPSDASPV